jgi:peroxiredoxin
MGVQRTARRRLNWLVTGCLLGAGAAVAQDRPNIPPGHSLHGEAFDEGPRQQAWKMPGVGGIDFPVTTASSEAQAFFNQGVAQLHTFYYFESERSFRQAALLDPKCAMTYWGMAMSNQNNGKRARSFLARARAESAAATDRERKYIEALEGFHAEGKSGDDRRRDYLRGLESVVLAYPDDIEAKAFLAWTVVGNSWGGDKISSHVAVDVLIEEVLRKSPMHPGAHHYRIHLWDNRDPAQAVRSAEAYAKAAPGIAHAWHMPGHIYNGLSRWIDAVYQQEGSARVDHGHMYEHQILPFQIHNYAHNQHYLIANIAHMGAVTDGIAFARNLIETPRDPGHEGAQHLGRQSLLKMLIRYERWDEILTSAHLEWGGSPEDRTWAAYGHGMAHLGKGDAAKAAEKAAELDRILATAREKKEGDLALIETAHAELRGRLAVRQGKLLEGFDLLSKGAKTHAERFHGDLSGYPRPFLESVAQAHLEAQDWGLAEACFREVLKDRKASVPCLAGLVEACFRRGELEKASAAFVELLEASRAADPDLACRKRLETLGIPVALAPAKPSRATLVSALALLDDAPGDPADEPPTVRADSRPMPAGHKLWTPSPAPDFELEAADGAKVKLSSCRGKHVLLAFYLGSACSHCVEQLTAIGKEKDAWEKLETRVLGISEDPPAKAKELLASPVGAAIHFSLLSDPGRATAKRYNAHDTFEDLGLHALVFIDKDGGIRWSRVSASPFMDIGFVKSEIERVQRLTGK